MLYTLLLNDKHEIIIALYYCNREQIFTRLQLVKIHLPTCTIIITMHAVFQGHSIYTLPLYIAA